MTAETNDQIYVDGSYLKNNATWHLEDSPFKAAQIMQLLTRHPEIRPASVCEIGCGAGGIIHQLQLLMPPQVTFVGYDVSPQAYELSLQFANERCRFVLGSAFDDPEVYDLVLAADVIEHVEDCFSFLRSTIKKSRWQIYHIPLDAHASAVVRGINAWDVVGHLHLFTMETALKTLEHTGHRVLDWHLTEGALHLPNKTVRKRLTNIFRYIFGKVSLKLSARLLGGYSMLVLTESASADYAR